MADQVMLKLQASEMAVSRSASAIYAAYIIAGRVADGSENQWMHKSVLEAIRIAHMVDQLVQSDDENRQREAF